MSRLFVRTAAFLVSLSLWNSAWGECPARLAVVTEQAGNEISSIRSDGEIVTLLPGLFSPRDIVLDAGGGVAYLVEGIGAAGQLSSFDLAAGRLRTVARNLGTPFRVDVDGSGATAYVRTSDGTLFSVELTAGIATVVASGLGSTGGLAVNAAGTVACVSVSGTVGVVDLATGVLSPVAVVAGAGTLDLDPTESTAYVVTSAGALVAVDLGTGAVTAVAAGLSGPRDVQVNAAGTAAHVFQSSGIVEVDLVTGVVTPLAGGLSGDGFAVDGAGDDAYVAAGLSDELVHVDLATGTADVLLRNELSGPAGIALDATETMAVVAEEDSGEVSAVDLTTGEVSLLASGLSKPGDVELDPTSTAAYVSREVPLTVMELVRVELSDGTVTTVASEDTFPMLPVPAGIDLNPDGTTAYFSHIGAAPALASIDLATGALIPLAGPGIDVAVNAAETTGYLLDPAGTLSVVDLATGVTALLTGGLGPAARQVALDTAETTAYVTTGPELLAVDLATGLSSSAASGLASAVGVAARRQVVFADVVISNPAPAVGSQIAACVFLDAGNTGAALGSFGAHLAWDPSVLEYVDFAAGDAPFDDPIVNDTAVLTGFLGFADADPAGACGNTRILCVEFSVVGPGAAVSPVDLTLTSVFAAGTFADLLPGAEVTDGAVEIPLLCKIGDVNRDGFLNSGDALLLLADEIGLPIPSAASEALALGCGDVNGDGSSNSIDANILLSAEVGLPIDPAFPLGADLTGEPTFDTCGVCLGLPSPLPESVKAFSPSTEAAVPEGTIVPRLGASVWHARRGEEFTLTVTLDATDTMLKLGSHAAHLRWDPALLTFLGTAPGRGGRFGAPILNASGIGAGELRFAEASPLGVGGTIDLVQLRFRAERTLPHPERRFELTFTSLGSTGPGFASLLPLLPPSSVAAAAERP